MTIYDIDPGSMYTAKEIGAVTGVSDETVRNLVDEGKISALPIEGRGRGVKVHIRIPGIAALEWWISRYKCDDVLAATIKHKRDEWLRRQQLPVTVKYRTIIATAAERRMSRTPQQDEARSFLDSIGYDWRCEEAHAISISIYGR